MILRNKKLYQERVDNMLLKTLLRRLITSELEAIQEYEDALDSIEDKNAQKVLADIASEEKVHVGELQGLLSLIDSKAAKGMVDGAHEVSNLIEGEKFERLKQRIRDKKKRAVQSRSFQKGR